MRIRSRSHDTSYLPLRGSKRESEITRQGSESEAARAFVSAKGGIHTYVREGDWGCY